MKLNESIKQVLLGEAFSKTVTTPEEGAIILKVADMMRKMGSYRNLHKGKGPNGNATEIFAEFVKDGEQIARVMVTNSYNENEVEVKVEVTSQKWSSRDRNYYDNAQITKEFGIDDSNLIKFLKNPIQGKFDDKASDAPKVSYSDDTVDKLIDQANDILYKTNRDEVANDYDTAALYSNVKKMVQNRKKQGKKPMTGKELADIMTRAFND
jgi:hypothetical protein